MSKEVAKKQDTQVASYNQQEMAGWGDSEFSQGDIIVPKIVLMQSSSVLVSSTDLKPGDYIHSVTKQVLGNSKSPVVFTPFLMKKFYRISVAEGRDFKFSHMEKWDQLNDLADKEFTLNGKPAQRQKVYQFYSLIEGYDIPFIITMKGVSFGTGKQLANEMHLVNKMKQLPPPGRMFKLCVEDVNLDNKIYKGYKIEEAGTTPMAMVKGIVFEWYKTISSGNVIEHDETELEKEGNASYQEAPMSDEVNGLF